MKPVSSVQKSRELFLKDIFRSISMCCSKILLWLNWGRLIKNEDFIFFVCLFLVLLPVRGLSFVELGLTQGLFLSSAAHWGVLACRVNIIIDDCCQAVIIASKCNNKNTFMPFYEILFPCSCFHAVSFICLSLSRYSRAEWNFNRALILQRSRCFQIFTFISRVFE